METKELTLNNIENELLCMPIALTMHMPNMANMAYALCAMRIRNMPQVVLQCSAKTKCNHNKL